MSQSSWNASNPAVKRLMKEMQSLDQTPSHDFVAYPLEDNIFQWHFTLRGPCDTAYSEGFYHGKLILPANYPFAPPDVILLTPNGRFELNKKICVSITSYHSENWNPTFNIAMVLSALREFMSTPGNNAIGAIEYPSDLRRKMAAESLSYECPHCHQSNAIHKARMDAVPIGSAPPSQSVKPTPPITPALEPALEPAQPTPVTSPQPQGLEAPRPVVDPLPPPQEEDAPAAPLQVQQQPRGPQEGIVINVRTLDQIIGFVFFAILAILAKKYMSGTLADALRLNL